MKFWAGFPKQKFGGVVIPLNSTRDLPQQVNVLFGKNLQTGTPFGDEEIQCLHRLSRAMMKDKVLRKSPAWMVLANWLNQKNSLRIRDEFFKSLDNNQSVPRAAEDLTPQGFVFHVSPGNVETMGWYSAALGVLTGNSNAVRISERVLTTEFQQALKVLQTIADNDFPLLLNRLWFLQYPHDESINLLLSQKSNARMLWGGDQTVDYFKHLPAKKDCVDLCFRDRVSAALISLRWLQQECFGPISGEGNPAKVAKLARLAADIYPFGQKACSSPRKIVFINDLANDARDVDSLMEYFHQQMVFSAEKATELDAQSLDYSGVVKFSQMCEDVLQDTAGSASGSRNHCLSGELKPKYFNARFTMMPRREYDIPDACGLGYVYYDVKENSTEALKALGPDIQTLVLVGVDAEKCRMALDDLPNNRVDRMVAPGHALDFSEIWDSYNIPANLIRLSGRSGVSYG